MFLCKILLCFSRKHENVCLPGTQSMNFWVEKLLFGFLTLVSRTLKLKKWFSKMLSARRNALWKNLVDFEELWKTLHSWNSKCELLGRDSFLIMDLRLQFHGYYKFLNRFYWRNAFWQNLATFQELCNSLTFTEIEGPVFLGNDFVCYSGTCA